MGGLSPSSHLWLPGGCRGVCKWLHAARPVSGDKPKDRRPRNSPQGGGLALAGRMQGTAETFSELVLTRTVAVLPRNSPLRDGRRREGVCGGRRSTPPKMSLSKTPEATMIPLYVAEGN